MFRIQDHIHLSILKLDVNTNIGTKTVWDEGRRAKMTFTLQMVLNNFSNK